MLLNISYRPSLMQGSKGRILEQTVREEQLIWFASLMEYSIIWFSGLLVLDNQVNQDFYDLTDKICFICQALPAFYRWSTEWVNYGGSC